ncbi:UDP-glycosyltransferase 74G1-like [Gastrolobium bilobum]|uniref:UDP-glycosyltransferase 74G1-like n=1 Tax=Gastrolobium bilobum TaxID=150636 RepID=UPI002AB00812|nr:UDP-glycosyltransferase 74G1-like [Gastrolobium bilobum]
MEKEKKNYVAHCLVLPYPAQGHINPMLQFSKRLVERGVKVTLITVISNWKTITNKNLRSIEVESISDGYDDGGLEAAESLEVYKDTFWRVGPQTLSELLQKLACSNNPADCVIYDAFLPWSLDVAKKFGLLGAAFFTQTCSVNNIYFHAYKKFVELPLSRTEFLLPGLPKLASGDLPSFLYKYGSYPGYFDIIMNQFSNIDKADWVLANTFYELEKEVVDWLGKIWPLKPIGPSVPSMFLDKRLQDDNEYGVSMFDPNIEACIKWLDEKPKDSVVYVSFGSMAGLSEEQTEELACGLRDSGSYFMWVVRACEQYKLPKEFLETSEKGLIVTWCPQLQVLTHEAVGCFLTHCGWNSTLEAVSLGVPMIAMPLWTDQITNAKHIADAWKMGIKAVADEKEIVRRGTIKHCIKEMMETEKGNEIKNNAIKWKNLAKNSIDEGGSSDKNIEDFVAKLAHC